MQMDDEFREFARRRSRAFLVRVKSTYYTVATIRAEIAELDATYDGVRAIDYSRDSVSTSPSPDGIPRLVERKQSLKEEYERELDANLQMQADAHRALRHVAEPARSVLTLHYLHGKTWTDVGEALNYSPDYCRGDLTEAGLLELYPHIPHEQLPVAY